MKRQRDHKAEYARRIAAATAKGFTRSQARGHARMGEQPARPPPKAATDPRLELALRELRQSGSRELAARSVNISPERFRRFLRENVKVEGRGRTLKIIDDRPREMTVFTRRKSRTLRVRDYDQASLNGRHQAAVAQFLKHRDASFLAPFKGESVIDSKGKRHPFETDPNAILQILAAGDGVFHEIYRLNS